MQLRERLATKYHLVNLLSLAVYPLLREFYFADEQVKGLKSSDMFGLSREYAMLFSVTMFLYLKWNQAPTIEAFLGKLYLFGKLFILVCLFMCETRITLYYVGLIIILLVAVPEPVYMGPTNVVSLSAATFGPLVEQDQSGRYHLVVFYTTWADTCRHFSPLFAKLSLQYGASKTKPKSKKITFSKIDIGLHADIARRYAIDASVTSKELPTLMLFRNGKPVEPLRLPPARGQDSSFTGKLKDFGGKYRLTEDVIVSFFDLKTRSVKVNKKE